MIEIRPGKFADSRSCDYANVTHGQLAAASLQHIGDVRAALGFFISRLSLLGMHHDADKLDDLDGFHANFVTGFIERDWLDRHYQKNRHHLEAPGEVGVRPDVNLLDVLDHIADQVMAGTARGTVRDVVLSDDLLQRALANTVLLLKGVVRLVPE